ncbi:hypothetical protein [Halovivax limisalsi]|uniref:hypothetical protein n=1 Tax=Halovivax limisalsi TaxID=1453760 RepID=UPI001FFC9FD9|nr:hypothetical protein [Halovivax limisalsi]
MTDATEPADATDQTLPLCPYCDAPVTDITSAGPHTHSASPCGCRLTLVDVQGMREV